MRGQSNSGRIGGFELTPQESGDLRRRGTERIVERSATLFNEGDPTDHVALIVEGRIKVSYFMDDGREVVLAIRESGDLVGEQSALDRRPRAADAIALELASVVLVAGDDFRSFLKENPRVTFELLALMSVRLREADRMRIEFGAFDTTGRVASRVVELAERFGEDQGSGLRVSVSLSQDELASWIGSSREAVSKSLGHLRRRGYIDTHRRGFTVLDIEGLRRRSS